MAQPDHPQADGALVEAEAHESSAAGGEAELNQHSCFAGIATATATATPAVRKVKRNRELASLEPADGDPLASRPPRRAAAAAQAALAQVASVGRQRGTGTIPPKPDQLSLVDHLLGAMTSGGARAKGNGDAGGVVVSALHVMESGPAPLTAAGGSEKREQKGGAKRKRAEPRADGASPAAAHAQPSMPTQPAAASKARPAAAAEAAAGGKAGRDSDAVPQGWAILVRPRPGCEGRTDKVYRHEASGKTFRSRVTAQAFWESPDGACAAEEPVADLGTAPDAEQPEANKRARKMPAKQASKAPAEQAPSPKPTAKKSKAPAERAPSPKSATKKSKAPVERTPTTKSAAEKSGAAGAQGAAGEAAEKMKSQKPDASVPAKKAGKQRTLMAAAPAASEPSTSQEAEARQAVGALSATDDTAAGRRKSRRASAAQPAAVATTGAEGLANAVATTTGAEDLANAVATNTGAEDLANAQQPVAAADDEPAASAAVGPAAPGDAAPTPEEGALVVPDAAAPGPSAASPDAAAPGPSAASPDAAVPGLPAAPADAAALGSPAPFTDAAPPAPAAAGNGAALAVTEAEGPSSAGQAPGYAQLLEKALPARALPAGTHASQLATFPASPKRAPPARSQVEAAGSDIPSMVAMAAGCSSVAGVVAAIDALLPASRGNNLPARLLRVAFAALRLGPFPTRKRSVPMMAAALWALAGKEGEAAARVAAERMFVDDLPPALRQFGLAEPPPPSPPPPPPQPRLQSGTLGFGGAGPAAILRARTASEASYDGAGFLSPAPPPAPPPVSLSSYDPSVVRLAEKIREVLALQRGQSASLKVVLKTGLLAGMAVRFQRRNGEVLLTGEVAGAEAGAMIVCHCAQCKSAVSVSPSEFELHAGSKDRRPADGIFLEDTGHSLKEVMALVNSAEMAADPHMDHCFACNQGGELVCCDACTAAYHLACAELPTVPEGDWLCALCLAEGRSKKDRPPLGAASAPPPAAAYYYAPRPPRHCSATPRLGAKQRPPSAKPHGSKPGRKPGRQAGGYAPVPPLGTARVHMVAPSAQRRLARPVRNLNRNKRLFEGGGGGLRHGDAVHYVSRGERVLSGVVVINPAGMSGIRCAHCAEIVSCSQFEAHSGHGQRRQPYEHIYTEEGLNLKAVSALLPALPDDGDDGDGGGLSLDDIADGCRDVISDLDTLASGCVLCRDTDFQRGEFGPRTIMLCDQCEREFHVGCLAEAGLAALQALPEGDWYCSERCGHIHALLRRCVASGQMDIPGAPDATWQVLNGRRDGQIGTTYAIKAAAEILQESFDPIMDLSTDTDLLPLMLYARQYGEWDYRGVHTLLMRHRGKPVVAATVRLFGPQMAELPLIATRAAARRQGHARVLVGLFENLLQEAGVRTLVLPAAHETVGTWKAGFGFEDMPPEMVHLAKQQLRILVFPGTQVLWKHMSGVEAPGGHHVLAALPGRAEAAVVAAVVQELVTAVAVAEGEEEPPPPLLEPEKQQQLEEEAQRQRPSLPLPCAARGAVEEAAPGGPGPATAQAAEDLVGLLATLPPPALLPLPAFAASPPGPLGAQPVADADPYEQMIQRAMAAGAAAAEAAAQEQAAGGDVQPAAAAAGPAAAVATEPEQRGEAHPAGAAPVDPVGSGTQQTEELPSVQGDAAEAAAAAAAAVGVVLDEMLEPAQPAPPPAPACTLAVQ